MKEEKDVKRFYDRDAAGYEERRFQSRAGRENHRNQVGLLENYLSQLQTGARILELGCGTGRFTEVMVGKGFGVTGVDLSRNMLRSARGAVADGPGSARFLHADGLALPFAGGEFDACVMINVASHLPRPSPVLAEVKRVLRPGGTLFVNFPHLWSLYCPVGLYVNARDRSLHGDVYTHWYSGREIRTLVGENNFQVRQTIGRLHNFSRDVPIVSDIISALDPWFRSGPLQLLASVFFLTLEKQAERKATQESRS